MIADVLVRRQSLGSLQRKCVLVELRAQFALLRQRCSIRMSIRSQVASVAVLS